MSESTPTTYGIKLARPLPHPCDKRLTSSMRVAILAAAIAAAPSNSVAFAEDWVTVSLDIEGFDDYRFDVLLDLSSIRVKTAIPNMRSATVKHILLSPKETKDSPMSEIAFSLSFDSFECDAQRFRLIAAETHFRDGAIRYVDPSRAQDGWRTADDPMTKKLLGLVCSYETISKESKE